MTPDAPSLHEIAAMPFPASVEAMRKHYVPDWGKPVPDGAEGKRAFKVRVEYDITISDDTIVEVFAFDEDEALELAEAQVEAEDTSRDVMSSEVLS